MPAIIDHDGPGGKPLALFESGAILLYLAEKTGKFMPSEMRARYNSYNGLMFQMAGVGPMFGQRGHFLRAAPEKIPYAIERYTTNRAPAQRDRKSSRREPVPGGDYSIADMATYPWVVGTRREPEELASRPNFKRWLDAIGDRARGKTRRRVMADLPPEPLDDQARSILYGAKQFERR